MVFIRAAEPGKKGIVTATRVKVLVRNADDATRLNKLDVDGAVLFPDAVPAINLSEMEDVIAKSIDSAVGQIADVLHPRPLWVKVNNGGEKVLAAQFKALNWLRERGYVNVSLLLPSIHSPKEVVNAKLIAERVGLPRKELNLGAIVDTPASAFLADELAHSGINFACIDVDKLSEHMLAHDSARFLGTLHLSVAKAVEHTAHGFRKYKIPVAILSTKTKPQDSIVRFIRARPDALVVSKEHLPLATYMVAKAERLLELEFRRDWVVKHI